MIVRMKKILLVTQKKDASSALEVLREEGTLHIEPTQEPEGPQINHLKDDLRQFEKILRVLSKDEHFQESIDEERCLEKAKDILGWLGVIESLEEEITRQQSLINQWEEWGDFNPKDIFSLKDKGIHIRLCEVPIKEFNRFPEGVIVRPIHTVGGMARCVIVSEGEKDIPFKTIEPPPWSLKEMKARQEEARKTIGALKRKIAEYGKYYESFWRVCLSLSDKLQFQEAYASMGDADELQYLKGYCPIECVDSLTQRARENGWAILVTEPTEEDKVPTLLRNPAWVRLIQPVFRLMNLLPGYREVDISPIFLIFLSIFFGILVGDAGYGMIYFLLTLWGQKKAGKGVKEKYFFFLMYVMSSCAILYGVLSGTLFGQAWLPTTFRPLMPWLRNNENVQLLCFVIGVAHLSVAHIWRVILKIPSMAVAGEVGWLFILWGMFFLVRKVILEMPLPSFVNYLFIIGILGVLFFSKPNRNILKALAGGLGDLLLNIISMFTDIVSYIRLFAVGMATVAVADAFNQMAGSLGMHSVIAGLVASLILVFGHALNVILSAMAILVHGIRLNVLEFSTHLNMEWTGLPYRPFAKTHVNAE